MCTQSWRWPGWDSQNSRGNSEPPSACTTCQAVISRAGPRQPVAAARAAGRDHELGLAQRAQQLGRVVGRQALALGDLGDRERVRPGVARHLEQAAEPVFLLRQELHGRASLVNYTDEVKIAPAGRGRDLLSLRAGGRIRPPWTPACSPICCPTATSGRAWRRTPSPRPGRC